MDQGFQQSTLSAIAIAENILGLDLQAFPNPFLDHFKLSGLPNESATIRLIQMDGKLILEQQAEGGETLQIDGSFFPAGQYVLLVVTESNHTTINIQKTK